MLKLLVFDCDGVIFDSRFANQQFYNTLLRHFGYPEMTEAELTYAHMHSADNAVRHIFRNHPISWEEIEKCRKEIRYAPFLKYMKLEEDLPRFLEHVYGDYNLAISTNRGGTMPTLLELHNLKKYFGKVVTSLSVKNPKPAPDGLLEILHHFSCSPEETLFIGDSQLDREQSAACGVALAAFKNQKLDAEYHISSFMELLELPPFRQSQSESE